MEDQTVNNTKKLDIQLKTLIFSGKVSIYTKR